MNNSSSYSRKSRGSYYQTFLPTRQGLTKEDAFEDCCRVRLRNCARTSDNSLGSPTWGAARPPMCTNVYVCKCPVERLQHDSVSAG